MLKNTNTDVVETEAMTLDEDKYDRDLAAVEALHNSSFYSSRISATQFVALDIYVERLHGLNRASRPSITEEEAHNAELLLYKGRELASERKQQRQLGLIALGSTVATGAFFIFLLCIAPITQSPYFVLGCFLSSMFLGLCLFAALKLGYEPMKEKVLSLVRG